LESTRPDLVFFLSGQLPAHRKRRDSGYDPSFSIIQQLAITNFAYFLIRNYRYHHRYHRHDTVQRLL